MSDVFYLYQYTSLESLAMILENKTIRFSNLSLLDDPLEKYIDMIFRSDRGQKIEKNNIGKICFVSCWTKTKEKSIAMWDMYGDRKKGVRIGLPSNMLNENYNIYGSEKSPIRFRIIAASNNGNPIPELIKVEYEKRESYCRPHSR